MLVSSGNLEKILAGVAEASVLLVKNLKLNDSLRQLVGIMGRAVEADRCYIFKNAWLNGEMVMDQQAEWTADGISVQLHNPELQQVSYSIYPSLLVQLEQGHPVTGLVAQSPEPFRSLMQAQDILSYLFLPIRANGALWGFIGYDACAEPRTWQEYESDALQTMANAFGSYLENQNLRSALEVSNQRYQLAIEGSKDGIWELDLRTNESFLSDLWFEIFGHSREQGSWTYEYWLNLVHPDDRQRVDQSFTSFLKRGYGTNDMEFRFLHGRGQYVWVQSKAAAEWDDAGKPLRMAGSDADITSRKINEQVLAENERQYRQLVNNLKEVVFEADAAGKFTFINQSWEKLTGYSIQETLGKSGIDFLHPSELPHVARMREELDRNPHDYLTYEIQYQHKKGHQVWAEVTLKRVLSPSGQTLGSAGTIIDLTPRRMAEKQLQLSEAKFRLISENITDIVTQHDTSGAVTFASPSMREVLGYDPKEITGINPITYIHPDDREQVVNNAFQKLLQGEKRISIAYRLRHKAGHYLWVESLTRFIPDTKGEVKAIQASTRDITERKKSEEEVARALEKEKELMELRSRFVMMASHEFRTPLATIRSSLDILRIYLSQADQQLQSKSFKHFDKMQLEIERVGELMNEILLLGKLEAGKTTLQLQSTLLPDLVNNLVEMHYSNLTDGRVPQVHIEGIPRPIELDQQLINHCLMNLVSNALKFSEGAPPPQIFISFKRHKVRVTVKDFGMGIKSSDKKRLFEPFYRGSNVGKIPGSGLGLVVVKEFVQLHGGKVFCSSSVGKGTSFNMDLIG